MITRRFLLQSAAAAAAYSSQGFRPAWAANAPGITDTEIKIGQTMPYSGPLSSYGVIGRTEAAYFKMINEQGGVNGRKINLISVDDGYSPPKTVEQVRRLVEQEQVAFLFQTLGTPTNIAIRQYLNDNKVPQLFVATGAATFSDPEHFPWTMRFNPSYQTEAHVYAKHILAAKPGAKIAVLYQNDDFGKDYLIGMKEVLGADRAGMIVKEASYEVAEPTVNSQVVTLGGPAPTCSLSPRRRNSPRRQFASPLTSVGPLSAMSATSQPPSPPFSSPPASRSPRASLPPSISRIQPKPAGRTTRASRNMPRS